MADECFGGTASESEPLERADKVAARHHLNPARGIGVGGDTFGGERAQRRIAAQPFDQRQVKIPLAMLRRFDAQRLSQCPKRVHFFDGDERCRS